MSFKVALPWNWLRRKRVQRSNTGLRAALGTGTDPHSLVLGTRPRAATFRPTATDSGQPGYVVDGGEVGFLALRVASCRGRDHSARGELRQDAYAVRQSHDGAWLIVAVADGVGSTPQAERAAFIAATNAVILVAEALASGTLPIALAWTQLMELTSQAILTGTASSGLVDKAPSTTITVALIPTDPRNGQEVIVANVGDSPAFILSADKLERISQDSETGAEDDQLGLMARDQTHALPQHAAAVAVSSRTWASGDVLIVATDGFANALGDDGQLPLSMHIRSQWATPPELLTFLRDVNFELATFGDDRTVAAVWALEHDTATRQTARGRGLGSK